VEVITVLLLCTEQQNIENTAQNVNKPLTGNMAAKGHMAFKGSAGTSHDKKVCGKPIRLY
jgi:hypothetical protein